VKRPTATPTQSNAHTTHNIQKTGVARPPEAGTREAKNTRTGGNGGPWSPPTVVPTREEAGLFLSLHSSSSTFHMRADLLAEVAESILGDEVRTEQVKGEGRTKVTASTHSR
jgi:hypothetical protein